MQVQDYPQSRTFTVRNTAVDDAVGTSGTGTVFLTLVTYHDSRVPEAADQLLTPVQGPEERAPDREPCFEVDPKPTRLPDGEASWCLERPNVQRNVPSTSHSGSARSTVIGEDGTVSAGTPDSAAAAVAEAAFGSHVTPPALVEAPYVADRAAAPPSVPWKASSSAPSNGLREAPPQQLEERRTAGNQRIDRDLPSADNSDCRGPSSIPVSPSVVASPTVGAPRSIEARATASQEGPTFAPAFVALAISKAAAVPEDTPGSPLLIPAQTNGEAPEQFADGTSVGALSRSSDGASAALRAMDSRVVSTGSADSTLWLSTVTVPDLIASESPRTGQQSLKITLPDHKYYDGVRREQISLASPSPVRTVRLAVESIATIVAPDGAKRPEAPHENPANLAEFLRATLDRPSASSAFPTDAYLAPLTVKGAVPIPAPVAADNMPDSLSVAEESLPTLPAEDGTIGRRGPEISPTPGAQSLPDTGRNVAVQLIAALSDGPEGSIEIHLSPEELGRVTMTLQVTDDAVVLAIQAERQDTLDLMRRHADILQREFREAGLGSLSFSFGQPPSDGRTSPSPGEMAPSGDSASNGPTSPSPSGRDRSPPSSRLDLRL